jgi:hypothetical protein
MGVLMILRTSPTAVSWSVVDVSEVLFMGFPFAYINHQTARCRRILLPSVRALHSGVFFLSKADGGRPRITAKQKGRQVLTGSFPFRDLLGLGYAHGMRYGRMSEQRPTAKHPLGELNVKRREE